MGMMYGLGAALGVLLKLMSVISFLAGAMTLYVAMDSSNGEFAIAGAIFWLTSVFAMKTAR